MVKTDPNKSSFGRVWELFSRFTYQIPQTLIGYSIASIANGFRLVNNVTHNYGVTAVDWGGNGGAMSLGCYSMGPNGYVADWRDHMFVHEYGHYIQSQQWGLLYMPVIAVPSVISACLPDMTDYTPGMATRHQYRWFEADASYKGMSYFDTYSGSTREDYVEWSNTHFDRNSFVEGSDSRYRNPRTGKFNSERIFPIESRFHWTDIVIYSYWIAFIF